jgi:hypothetical protein
MKQDMDWVTINELFDPSLLFKLIKKFVLKQSGNQYKMAVLIAEQLSILLFCQDNQVGNAVYYYCFTTKSRGGLSGRSVLLCPGTVGRLGCTD